MKSGNDAVLVHWGVANCIRLSIAVAAAGVQLLWCDTDPGTPAVSSICGLCGTAIAFLPAAQSC